MKRLFAAAIVAGGFGAGGAVAAPISQITITTEDDMTNVGYLLCSISNNFNLEQNAEESSIQKFCVAKHAMEEEKQKEWRICSTTRDRDTAQVKLDEAMGEIDSVTARKRNEQIARLSNICIDESRYFPTDAEIKTLFEEHIGSSITLTLSSP